MPSVFLAVFIPLAFVSHRFSETVKHSPIGPLDRAAGVAFGIVRGLVFVGLAYLAFTYFVPLAQASGLDHGMRGCCRWCSPPPRFCSRWFPTIRRTLPISLITKR